MKNSWVLYGHYMLKRSLIVFIFNTKAHIMPTNVHKYYYCCPLKIKCTLKIFRTADKQALRILFSKSKPLLVEK